MSVTDNFLRGSSNFVGLAMDNAQPDNPAGGCSYVHDAGAQPQEHSIFFSIGQSGYCGPKARSLVNLNGGFNLILSSRVLFSERV